MSNDKENDILSSIKEFFNQRILENNKNIDDDERILGYKIDRKEIDDEVKKIVSNESGVDRVKELFRYE